MRLNRFYTERINITINSSVLLNQQYNTHIRKVLRLESGDKIILFNGEKEYLAQLKTVCKEAVTAVVIDVIREENFSIDKKIDLYLFQGLPKAGKMDLIIEKTTEIGIDGVIPFDCEYSQNDKLKSQKKIERWRKVALAASQQANRITVPEIFEVTDFYSVINLSPEFDAMIMFTVAPKGADKISLEEMLSKIKIKKGKIGFLVGPEGGFSPKEIEAAKECNIKTIQVFQTTLRTETASIALTSLMRYSIDNMIAKSKSNKSI